jgi:hypothetical protein
MRRIRRGPKSLILFLGSGVSRASGLPLADQLTDVILGSPALPLVEDSLDPRLRAGELRERIESLLQIMADFDTRDAKRTNALFRGRTSYEDLFYLCEEMTNWRIGLADNSTLTSFMKAIERRARPLLSGPNLAARLNDLGLLAREARLFIQAVTTTILRRGEPAGLDLIVDLARSGRISQLNIMTLNHDTLGFQEVLRGCDVILMCGYGWGDAAINLRLDTWMDDPRKRIILLHPDPKEITARSMITASAYDWWSPRDN